MTNTDNAARSPRPSDFPTLVTALMSVAARSIEEQLRDEGFSLLEYAILRALGESGTSTATQLSHLMPVDVSGISRTVDALVRQGKVRRQRRRDDRRVVMLSLTPDGRESSEELFRSVDERYTRLLSDIGEREMDVFVSVVHRILDNHAAARRAG